MEVHDFRQKLAFSNGVNMLSDVERITHALGERCIKVDKTDVSVDKTGIDYYAYLSDRARVNVDAKRREAGASRWWKHGSPELAIETFSVVEPPKVGWTFNNASDVDYILYSFEPEDSNDYYFLPFQLLRKVAWENRHVWKAEYKELTQTSDGWQSKCIFVPAYVVISAILEAMIHKGA